VTVKIVVVVHGSFKNVIVYILLLSSFLGSTAQLRPWPPPKNPADFHGGFSTKIMSY